MAQPLRQPGSWSRPSLWRPDRRRVSHVAASGPPIPMSSDQQEEIYDSVQEIHQESRVAGGDLSVNSNAATHGHSASQPPRVYEMDAFKTKIDDAVAEDAAAAADSSYASYDEAPDASTKGTYPAARPGSKYGEKPKEKGKYPAAKPAMDETEGKYPAAVPDSHYGELAVDEEPTWQEHPWVQPVTPLPFDIDPPRVPFRPRRPFRRPVIVERCNCGAYNTFGAATGTTVLALNAVLFILLAIANAGGGRSLASGRDKDRYEAHYTNAVADGVMAALPPLSPEISHQALRFACDLMGFTQPDYSGHENFVLSKPTDLNAALHNISHGVAISGSSYGNHSQAASTGYGPQGGVHMVQGSPGAHHVVHEKPGGVHVITAGSSVHVYPGTSGVQVETPSASVSVVPGRPSGSHTGQVQALGPPGSTQTAPTDGIQVLQGTMATTTINQAPGSSHPSPGVSVQVLGGTANHNCQGLCIETTGGVIPVEGSPRPSSDSSSTTQSVTRPPGLVTIADFRPGTPPEQVVSAGESGQPTARPGEILAGIASLTGEPQPRPPGVVSLPELQGMANVVVASGEQETLPRPPTDANSGATVSPSSMTSAPPPNPGATASPTSVQDLLQNLLLASGVSTGTISPPTQPEPTGPSSTMPNELSTPSPPSATPSFPPAPPLTAFTPAPLQFPDGSQTSQPTDTTDAIISNINDIISGMVISEGLGVTEKPDVFPGTPAPPTLAAVDGAVVARPTLVPISGEFITPPSHVITDGVVFINGDGVMTSTNVGEGTWFGPTEPSVGEGQSEITNGQTPENAGGAPEDSNTLIEDINGGITDVPENAELPEFPTNFGMGTPGGEDSDDGDTSGSVADIVPDSVNISSTIEILSTLGTVEDLEEIPLKGGYFELHILPTQPVPSPPPSELEFRFPPITIITTTYPSTPTLAAVPAATPTPIRTLQITPTTTKIMTTTATVSSYDARPGPITVKPTTSWGDPIVYNDQGFWKPPTKPPSSFLAFKSQSQSLGDPANLGSPQASANELNPSENNILDDVRPEPSTSENRPNTPNLAANNPYIGEPEPTAIADLFSQLEASEPVNSSPVNIMYIQQINPSDPMMMMPNRVNLADSPIISVMPKPPILFPQRVTATTTIITIGTASTSTTTVTSGSTGQSPTGFGSSSTSLGNPGGVASGSASESNAQQGIFISLHPENDGSYSQTASGDQAASASDHIPFQAISAALPITKKPNRLTTWTGDKFSSTTAAPAVFQSGGWHNLFEAPPTTSSGMTKFNELGFWKPTRRPMVFSKLRNKAKRKGTAGSTSLQLLGRNKHKGGIAASAGSVPRKEEILSTARPSFSSLTGKPSTSTHRPRITASDITSAAADGSLPNLIQSLFSNAKNTHSNQLDRKEVTKPYYHHAKRPLKSTKPPPTTPPTTQPTLPPSPTTTRRTALPTPGYNKHGFWKPTKRPYRTMMQRLKQKMRDRTRMPSTTEAPAPPPVGPPTFPLRRSFINGNFRPNRKRPQGWRGRRDAPSPPPPPPPPPSSSRSFSDSAPTSMDLLLDSVGRSFGAASIGHVETSPEGRSFRRQFRPNGRRRPLRRQFSSRCITRCWLGTVGILGGMGGLAALAVPVYLSLVSSVGAGGAGGGIVNVVGTAAGGATGVNPDGTPFVNDPIPDPNPTPIAPPIPIPLPGPLPGPILIPLPDPAPPAVPDPKPPGVPDEAKPPAPPDAGSGSPPGLPDEVVNPPSPPPDKKKPDTGEPGAFIEGEAMERCSGWGEGVCDTGGSVGALG